MHFQCNIIDILDWMMALAYLLLGSSLEPEVLKLGSINGTS
jgi:hypothetical protein